MPSMSVMIKPVSGLCNMKCEYCFYTDEMNNRNQALYGIMQAEVMKNIIKKSLSFATSSCTFIFQGGEPTLAGLAFYQQWIEYEKQYNERRIEVHHAIQTNGLVIDEAWCRFFRDNNFLVGLSLDGLEGTHDRYRKDMQGNGTFAKVMEAARKLKEEKVEFNILTVVNKETATHISSIYEMFKKQDFIWQQYIACLPPLNSEPHEAEYSVSPELYGNFLTKLFMLWEKDVWNGTQPYIRQFENYIGILLGIYPESCEQRGVCSFQMVIEADGSVYPCDFYALDEYKLGNLVTDDFNDIGKAREKSDFVKRSYNHTKTCLNCEYHFICRGGCYRNRTQFDGEKGHNYLCDGYRQFFDNCLPNLKKIAEWVRKTQG